MADGRDWPGWSLRFCPVCGQRTGTHRIPDEKHGELVVYHDHDDTTGERCIFAGDQAAIRAVAFTAADTGTSPRRTAEENLSTPRGTMTRAADELLARLTDQERHPHQ
jgi:glycerophosphoryl diester phosphodiesterase